MEDQKNEKSSNLNIPVNIVEYYYLLVARKWLLVSLVLLFVVFTTIYSVTTAPIYEANAKIVIDRESSKSPLTGERLEYGSYLSEQLDFKTHFTLIKSRPVLEKVVIGLALFDREEPDDFIKAYIVNVKTNLKEFIKYIFGSI